MADASVTENSGADVPSTESGQSGASTPQPAGAFVFGNLQGQPLSISDYLIFLVVFALALALRLAYLFQISQCPLFDSPVLDAQAHDQWARMIREGIDAFPGTAYFKAPLYPYFLAVVRILTGDDFWAPRVVQIVIGSASCGFIYLLGREAFNRTVGVIAGVAAASYWVMIYYDAELLLEPLSIFLTTISLWLVMRAARRERVWLWIIAGILMGLSAINRPNVLILIPVIAFWIAWIFWRHKGAALIRAAAWCVACALPILPVTIRNYVVGDDLVLIASQAGPNFYIGNNPASDGFTANLPGSRSTWLGGFQDWTSMAEVEMGRKLKASEVDRFFFDKAFAFIRSTPGRALEKMLVKLQLYFLNWEIPNDSDPHSMAGIYAPWMTKLPVTSGAILALGLIGFAISLGEFRRLFPLLAFVVLYSASVIAFFVCARFRVPVMPVAIVLAAIVPVKLIDFARRRDFRTLIGVGVFTYLSWIGMHREVGPVLMNKYAAVSHQRIGLKLAEKGLPGEAEEYQKAIELNPESPEALTGFAFYHKNRGEYDLAIDYFRRVLAVSAAAEVHAELASLLGLQGEWEQAIEVLRRGLIDLPGYLDLKRKLAFVLATCPIDHLRDGVQAVRLAEDVASVGDEIPQTYDTLAVAYAEVGRFEDAVRMDQKALDLAVKLMMPDAVEQITARLSLFKDRKPFRQPLRTRPRR